MSLPSLIAGAHAPGRASSCIARIVEWPGTAGCAARAKGSGVPRLFVVDQWERAAGQRRLGISRPNVLASRISSLRSRLLWLGLEIPGSSATGYCLRTTATVPATDTGRSRKSWR